MLSCIEHRIQIDQKIVFYPIRGHPSYCFSLKTAETHSVGLGEQSHMTIRDTFEAVKIILTFAQLRVDRELELNK